MPVLKIMQTNACAKDCFYCPFRAGRAYRREAFRPEELAGLFDGLRRARLANGIFLSSGVVGHDDHSMEQMIDTVAILRRTHRFRGYVHLKLMPRASDAALEAALALADRVSMNLEAPSRARLARLSGTKDLARDLLAPLRRVRDLFAAGDRRVSRTTQFVVGAAGETDAEILRRTDELYRDLGLARVYYSAFRPVPDTPLENRPAEDPRRALRLYQADALLRDYGFRAGELPMTRGGLPRDEDPKLAWARRHPERFPIELAEAPRADLLRVPGLGPKTADRLLEARATGLPRTEAEMRRLGLPARALAWVQLRGRRPVRQLRLPMD